MEQCLIENLYDLSGTIAADLFEGLKYPWEVLPLIVVGEGATVGNSTELKNVILFRDCEVPHYNYVGDSILGIKAHMGAGAITSNVKADRKNVVVKDGEVHYETGLRKFGAMLGDHVEVGCNSVLNPGTVVGRWTNIYPLSMVRGVVPEHSIYKSKTEIVVKREDA